LGVPASELPVLVVHKRSIDARRGRVRFHVLVGFVSGEPVVLGGAAPREVKGPAPVVIVGDGPAGLFCAYALARRGIGSVIVDRGKLVQPRRHDLKGLNRKGIVDPDSNYCFGEGGAGTYSDGKLYTRSHKRGDTNKILEIFHEHGADENILVEAHPHIGTNKLPHIIENMREVILAHGGEIYFN